ncbi:unnamed protein product [Amoebophrya sp. A120]|nr:unnamed protein product [Amoebophrya sp. A120]|eukprot:GSA120T00009978001.1
MTVLHQIVIFIIIVASAFAFATRHYRAFSTFLSLFFLLTRLVSFRTSKCFLIP